MSNSTALGSDDAAQLKVVLHRVGCNVRVAWETDGKVHSVELRMRVNTSGAKFERHRVIEFEIGSKRCSCDVGVIFLIANSGYIAAIR